MKLGVAERITLQGILPAEGDLITMRVLKDLKTRLGFTEDEIKHYNIQASNGQISWKNGDEAEIEIGEVATGIINGVLKKLDQDKKISEQTLSLYDKFCP